MTTQHKQTAPITLATPLAKVRPSAQVAAKVLRIIELATEMGSQKMRKAVNQVDKSQRKIGMLTKDIIEIVLELEGK